MLEKDPEAKMFPWPYLGGGRDLFHNLGRRGWGKISMSLSFSDEVERFIYPASVCVTEKTPCSSEARNSEAGRAQVFEVLITNSGRQVD